MGLFDDIAGIPGKIGGKSGGVFGDIADIPGKIGGWFDNTRSEDLANALGKYDPQSQMGMDLLGQQAQGKKSFAEEQVRQSLEQAANAQQSMAATARPGQQVAAQRMAGQQGSQLMASRAGAGAMARLAEQQQAARAYSSLLLGLRGQDLQGQLGLMAQPTMGERFLGAGSGAANAYITSQSDKRSKKDIAPADKKAEQLLEGLQAYSYKYKDEKHGKGEQLGIMAQDLEKAGLPHAVVNTPEGKRVHGPKLAGALAAASAQMHKRLKKLENAG